MLKMHKLKPAVAALCGIFIFSAVAGASLGPHDRTTVGTEAGGACAYCHNNTAAEALRGFKSGAVPVNSGWGTRPIAILCYKCHLGNLGANNVIDLVYDNLSANPSTHGFDASAVGKALAVDGVAPDAGISASNLPYTDAPLLDCTSCHNVHDSSSAPFLRTGKINDLCVSCHLGRDAVGHNNSGSDGVNASTHPVRMAIQDGTGTAGTIVHTPGALLASINYRDVNGVWVLGAKTWLEGASEVMGCPTCHEVHNSHKNEDYLFVNNQVSNGADPLINNGAGAGSALCEACHSPDDVTGYTSVLAGSDHPINDQWRGIKTNIFYPRIVMLPINWKNNKLDITSGPAPFVNNGPDGYSALGIDTDGIATNNGGPHCSSCHDVHGGRPATSLLQAPDNAPPGGFCFECHAFSNIIPYYHHSVQGNYLNSVLVCGDCHGDGSGTWNAHGGFAQFRVAVAEGDSNLCIDCHTSTDPTTLTPASGFAQNNWPAHHGEDRGGGSHYLGPDTDEIVDTTVKTDAWSTGYFSEYGGQTGGGDQAPFAAGDMICESCHNIIFNDGRYDIETSGGKYTNGLQAGWESNLLLEAYEDDLYTANIDDPKIGDCARGPSLAPGIGDGDGIGVALCFGCHFQNRLSGEHHPFTGETVSKTGLPLNTTLPGSLADQTNAPIGSVAGVSGGPLAPGTLSYPCEDAVDCDSCHRPHEAATESNLPIGSYGKNKNLFLILEVMGANGDHTSLCTECHGY